MCARPVLEAGEVRQIGPVLRQFTEHWRRWTSEWTVAILCAKGCDGTKSRMLRRHVVQTWGRRENLKKQFIRGTTIPFSAPPSVVAARAKARRRENFGGVVPLGVVRYGWSPRGRDDGDGKLSE